MLEPWMSGSHADVDPLIRPLLHSIDHVKLDVAKWTEGLTAEQLWSRPMDLGAIGFHIRHIAGSSDRLFTYARGQSLTDEQMAFLRSEESTPGASREELLAHLNTTLDNIATAARTIDPASLSEPRAIGRKHLPTTLNGLLVHMAEHMQRHVGELIVIAKVVRAS